MLRIAPSSHSRGVVLSRTFMIVRFEKSARPALASLPDAPAPYTAVWLTPQLKDRTSMWFALLVLGPSTPSTYRYALTAIGFSPSLISSYLKQVKGCAIRAGCRLFGGRRQLRYEPQGNRQLVQLEVRPQERHRAVDARLARHFRYIHARLAQGAARFHRRRSRIVRNHVLGNPAVQEQFRFGARHEAADLVAHHGLQIMGEPGDGHQVRQLGRKPGIGVGRVGVVGLGLLAGLH